jgi:hypothetical protein
MTLPITIPNTFANATASIPLSQLDNNFSTVVVAVNGIGNGAESLSNVSITGGSVANVTLANVSISGETLNNVTLTNVSITSGNATFTTANVTTLDLTNIEVTNIKAKDGTAAIAIADSTGVTTQSTPAIISVNSASDALRITQVGSGNALLVEDSANPDATPFVVRADGAVVRGHTASISGSITPMLQAVGADSTSSSIGQYSFSAISSGPILELGLSANATIGSQTVVADGNGLGAIRFSGSDGTQFIRAAQIAGQVDGTPGTNDMPGRLLFSTTADGASTPTERMRITNDGRLVAGNGAGGGSGATQFTLGGTLVSASNVTRAYSNIGTAPTTSTTEVTSYYSQPTTADGIGAVATISHFSANQGTITGGTRTVPTNQYGFLVNNTLTGATNNYGFFSNIASGTGRWNFYANGTADNFFAGQVQLGAGTVSAPALSTTGDTNTGIFFPAADTIAFAEGGAEAMRINSSGAVLIGGTTQASSDRGLNIETTSSGSSTTSLALQNQATGNGSGVQISFRGQRNTGAQADYTYIQSVADDTTAGNGSMRFWTTGSGTPAERMRINSGGAVLVGRTDTASAATKGIMFLNSSRVVVTILTGESDCITLNRQDDDGNLMEFRQANTAEGTISVSGSTVSYNGGHLSRWAQMLTKPDLLKGTVMSNLDEMNVYVKPTLYWTEEDELPVDEEGNPTVAVGDLKQETSVSDNEQLNKVKVSDVEGDANVAGVFVNWCYDEAHQVDEINMAMTGDMIIRIAQGTTVARGDLLMSAGDGTAKPQDDDIVRSKTIAKVTSTHVTCTYDDGSYCVPCVLMAC